jgi:hypothetical protein
MEKRTALRFPTDLTAECRTPERSWDSRLCNISTSGCMISCDEGELVERAMLRIRVRGLAAIDAEVVWQNRNHAGIRFRAPLHPAAMEHLGFELPDDAWARASSSVSRVRQPQVPARRVAPSLSGGLIKRVPSAAEIGS